MIQMALVRLAIAFLVLHLISVHVYANCPPPTIPPVKPPMPPPTSPPPVKPPTQPPVQPPTSSPPVKPPTQPPVKPPTSPPTSSPPVKPPTQPPVKPPTSPPTSSPPVKPPTSSPPVKPPTSPPTSSPPVKPPTSSPPVKPPTSPPTSSPPVKPPTNSPPVKPPTLPPTSPPVKPPTQPPVSPPTSSPGSYGVAVQGVVFCRSVCNYRDKYNKVTRTALQGAVVKLVCKTDSEKDGGNFMRKAKTDESGNFTLKTSRIKADDGAKNCKLFLVRSHDRECNVPTSLNGGSTGATLTLAFGGKKFQGRYSVFNVGPFAFEPAKTKECVE